MQQMSNCKSTCSASNNNKVLDDHILHFKALLRNDMKKCNDPARIDRIKYLIKNGKYNIPSAEIADAIINCKKNY